MPARDASFALVIHWSIDQPFGHARRDEEEVAVDARYQLDTRYPFIGRRL